VSGEVLYLVYSVKKNDIFLINFKDLLWFLTNINLRWPSRCIEVQNADVESTAFTLSRKYFLNCVVKFAMHIVVCFVVYVVLCVLNSLPGTIKHQKVVFSGAKDRMFTNSWEMHLPYLFHGTSILFYAIVKCITIDNILFKFFFSKHC
jgi:hypothetical protein